MKLFFYKFGKNIVDSFKGSNFLWHCVAILSTYFIIIYGFDWKYYNFFITSHFVFIFVSMVAIGGIVPILAPLVILIFGKIRKNAKLLNTGFALAQAVALAYLISSTYKAFTGRAHPDHVYVLLQDVTHIFRFGFLRGGIFWGWPSTHTTIAFAMAFCLWALYPKNNNIKILSLIYALFVGIGVSVTVHFFSDFTAGIIIGTVIGNVVGKTFEKRNQFLS